MEVWSMNVCSHSHTASKENNIHLGVCLSLLCPTIACVFCVIHCAFHTTLTCFILAALSILTGISAFIMSHISLYLISPIILKIFPNYHDFQKERLSLLANKILKESPDVICLQELFSHRFNSSFRDEFLKKLKGNGYVHVFEAPRQTSQALTPGIMIISKHRLENTRCKQFTGFGPLKMVVKRAMISCSIEKEGKHYEIVGCHFPACGIVMTNYSFMSQLSHYYDPKRDIEEFTDFVQKKNRLIACGDFNIEPNSDMFQHLKKELKKKGLEWVENYEFTSNAPKNTLLGSRNRPKCIDHVFTSGIQVKEFGLDPCLVEHAHFNMLSDHVLLKTTVA